MATKEPLLRADGRDLNELLASLEQLVRGAKSTAPRHTLLSRKKTKELLALMRVRLTEAEGVGEPRQYAEAVGAIDAFSETMTEGGFMPWTNIWRIFYLDVSRDKALGWVAELREKLEPFAKAPAAE